MVLPELARGKPRSRYGCWKADLIYKVEEGAGDMLVLVMVLLVSLLVSSVEE